MMLVCFSVALSIAVGWADAQLQWRKLFDGITTDVGVLWPPARKDFAIGYDSERRFITIFGGLNAKNEVLGDTWVLDLFLSRWYSVKSQGPEPRYGMAYGVYEDRLYVTLGCNHTRCFNDVFVFNPASFQWFRLDVTGPNQPVGRRHSAFGIFPRSNVMVVSGGKDLINPLSSSFAFDLSNQRWFEVETWQSTYDPSRPHARFGHAGSMVNNSKLLIFGGCVKHGPCPSADSWIFDAESRVWSKLDFCGQARQNGQIATLPDGRYSVMYGGDVSSSQQLGDSGSITADELVIFDSFTKQWSMRKPLGSIPSIRHSHGFVTSPLGIFLFGGQLLNGSLENDMWLLSGSVEESALVKGCRYSFFTLVSLHGLLMFFAFGLLLPLGALLAQYAVVTESLTFNWRYVHKATQAVAILFAISGFICGCVAIQNQQHFRSVHSALGLIIFILLIAVQPTLALLRQLMLVVHNWFGLFLLLLGFINVSLGVFLSLSVTFVWIGWFVIAALLMALFLGVQVTDCRYSNSL